MKIYSNAELKKGFVVDPYIFSDLSPNELREEFQERGVDLPPYNEM